MIAHKLFWYFLLCSMFSSKTLANTVNVEPNQINTIRTDIYFEILKKTQKSWNGELLPGTVIVT